MSNERNTELVNGMLAKGWWVCPCGRLNEPLWTLCHQCRKQRKTNDEKAAQMVEAFRPMAVAAQALAQPRKSESELQTECERLLVRAGYHRLTERNLMEFAWSEVAGWYAHWPQAIGNPIMPDVVVWNRAMTRTLMVELKASIKRKQRKAQKAAITARLWRVVYSPDEFGGLLAEWRGTL